MMRFSKSALAGLSVALGLLVAACSPVGGAARSGSAVQNQFGPGATATAEVLGVQATPLATASPADIQATFTDMDRFSQQLITWAKGNPSPSDLINMVQHATVLMGDLHAEFPQMTAQQQTQALQKMSDIAGEMAQVVNAHARLQESPTPETMVGTPGTPVPPLVGTPGSETPFPMIVGTPTSTAMAPATLGPAGAQQLETDIDQLRQALMNLITDQPTEGDIIDLLYQFQAILRNMAQQPSQLSQADLTDLMGGMAQAMDDMAKAAEVHVVQETGSMPGLTPPPTAVPY